MPLDADLILSGDPRALARAATEVENATDAARDLLRHLFPYTGRAVYVGITGPAGAGKSTLASRLASAFRQAGHSVGILAVDPTSPFSGGAILGDRIRMQSHHSDPGVFIRSLATRGRLGGLAAAAYDLALLLDAAGRDYVLIETVGAGQDEVEIARLAHVTVVVLMPGAGDGVQVLKAGILEIAGIFVINKADMPGADELETELRGLWAPAPGQQKPEPPVLKTVATEGHGVAELAAAIQEAARRNRTETRAREQWAARLREMLKDRLIARLPEGRIAAAAAAVATRQSDPYTVVEELIGSLLKEAPES
jgi:LAO/AO transport system kinase